MQTQYTGHNIEITPALREYADKKLQKITNNRDYITSIHVTFNVDKLSQIAEAQINVPKQTIHAKSEADEMHKAIDALIDKLERQLIKYRDKVIEQR